MKDKEKVLDELRVFGITSTSNTDNVAKGVMVRDEWVNEVHIGNLSSCINCGHFHGSHSMDVGEEIYGKGSDKCWGIRPDGEECACRRFSTRNG